MSQPSNTITIDPRSIPYIEWNDLKEHDQQLLHSIWETAATIRELCNKFDPKHDFTRGGRWKDEQSGFCNGATAFILAAARRSPNALMELIKHFDTDFLLPDAQDDDGRTALMLMCLNGHTNAMRLLVEQNGGDARRALGDPARQSEAGSNALIWASKRGQCEVFDLLLDLFGAEALGPPSHKTNYGHTALIAAASEGRTVMIRKLASHGETFILEEERRTAANWPREGTIEKTALSEAVRSNQMEAVAVIVECFGPNAEEANQELTGFDNVAVLLDKHALPKKMEQFADYLVSLSMGEPWNKLKAVFDKHQVDLSGYYQYRVQVAPLGSTGAGKTTLMNHLARNLHGKGANSSLGLENISSLFDSITPYSVFSFGDLA
jgi:hypothetical protein